MEGILRKKGINKRLTFMLVVLMTLMGSVVGLISAVSLRHNYYNLYSEKAQDLVRLTASEIDGDWLKSFSETYEKDAEYEKLITHLNNIKTNFAGIQYLYVFKPGDTGFTYLMEACKEGDDIENIAKPGDWYEYVEHDYEAVVKDIEAGRASEGLHIGPDVGYGQTISAWAPVFDSEHNLVAMVDADYVIENLLPRIASHTGTIVLMEIVFICLTVTLMIFGIRNIVIRPVNRLTKLVGAYEYGSVFGDLSAFNRDDEISWLAHSFGDMAERLDLYIRDLTAVTAEKERIGAELNVATKIQADMLPRTFPAFPEAQEFDIYATMDPAKEVGGDFYDFFRINDDQVAIVIADVSGKGVPAALFMVIAKTMIKNRALAGNYDGPGEVLEWVNNQLCEGNDADLFVTVWFGIFTISTGHIAFASAGHEYPAFCRNGKGFVLEKERHGMPLAAMEDIPVRNHETKLEKGEILYLYTDGVTEATSMDDELFGEERMIESLNKNCSKDMEDMLRKVRADIDEFVGEAPQFDDITMLALYYHG